MSNSYLLPRISSVNKPLRLGVLISGSGSGLEALLKYQELNECSHETVVVISDKIGVKGIDRAVAHGVMAITLPLPDISNFDNSTEQRVAHENAISMILDEYSVELVVCSGYMRILTDSFLSERLGRVVNIHPSPWGDGGALFPGAHGIRDTLAAGVKEAGASVHFVSVGVDDGPLIASETTIIDSDENENKLGERVKLEIEHKLYPLVIDALAEGKVVREGKRFVISE